MRALRCATNGVVAGERFAELREERDSRGFDDAARLRERAAREVDPKRVHGRADQRGPHRTRDHKIVSTQ